MSAPRILDSLQRLEACPRVGRERGFSIPNIFIRDLGQVSRLSRGFFYIDSNLSNGVKGEDVAWILSKRGFSNLYLATGFNASEFRPMTWIKAVIGKEPPWGD